MQRGRECAGNEAILRCKPATGAARSENNKAGIALPHCQKQPFITINTTYHTHKYRLLPR